MHKNLNSLITISIKCRKFQLMFAKGKTEQMYTNVYICSDYKIEKLSTL